ncbi:PAS domain S-box protein [candidate division KSB1 bacterium]
MAELSVKKNYLELLKIYIVRSEEKQLAAAAKLGRALLRADFSIEEIAEVHEEALCRLAKDSPKLRLVDVIKHTSTFFIETVIAYSLAFREQLEGRKRADERFHKAHDELEIRVQERTVELAKLNKELLIENLERKRIQEAQKRRIELIKLITSLSTKFINIDLDKIDDEIHLMLQRIGKFVGIDRSYVFLLSDDRTEIDNTYEWCAEGIKVKINNFKNLFVEFVPWWMKKLNQFEFIYIPRVSDLPSEAEAEKKILQSQDIQSLLVIPMIHGSSLIGFLGFDSVRVEKTWSEDEAALLTMTGEILVNTLGRMQMEKVLREREESLRKAQQIAHLGNWHWNIQTNETWWSDEIYCILGLDPNEYEATYETFLNAVHSDDREFVKDVIRKALYEKRPYSIDHRILLPDGVERIIHEEGEVSFDETGKPVWMNGTGQDITEQKQAEKRIVQLNQLYSILININQAIIRFSDRTKLFKKVCRILVEYDLFKMAWIGIVNSDTRLVKPVAHCGMDKGYLDRNRISTGKISERREPSGIAIRRGKRFICDDIEQEQRLVQWRDKAIKFGYRSSGSFPLRVQKNVIGSLNVYSSESNFFNNEKIRLLDELADDISFAIESMKKEKQRKKAEELLRKLSRAVEQSPTSVIITDTKGSIEYVNPKFTQVTGYTFDEVIGKNPRILKADETPPETHKKLWETITAGKEWSGEFHNKKKNGELYWEYASISPVRNEKDVISHFIAVNEDITERKQMEERVIHSEKMASIGTLATGIVHEINNPMGYISSNLKILKKYNKRFRDFYAVIQNLNEEYSKGKPDELGNFIDEFMRIKEDAKLDFLLMDMKDAVEESIEGIEKIKKIVSDLKDFSRMEKPEIKISNVNNGIEKTLNVVWNELKYKAEVIKEFGDISEVECDIQRLNQVFMNILVNAAQAIEKRGTIRIKTFSTNDYVVIQISDTGKGIPKEYIRNIFDAFFTTKEPGKGTGLGLSISYKIIQDHFGRIDVESEVGKGTTFTIKLPLKKI